MTQIGLLQSQLGNEIRIVLQDIQKNGQLPCIHASISVTQTFHTFITPPGSHACSPPCLWFLPQSPLRPTISQAHLLLLLVHEESELIIQESQRALPLQPGPPLTQQLSLTMSTHLPVSTILTPFSPHSPLRTIPASKSLSITSKQFAPGPANEKYAQSLPVSLSPTPVDSAWSNWHNQFITTMPNVIPTKKLKRTNNIPYLSSDLLKLIRKKHQLYKSAKRTATQTAWDKFKKIRNHTTSALKAIFSSHLPPK